MMSSVTTVNYLHGKGGKDEGGWTMMSSATNDDVTVDFDVSLGRNRRKEGGGSRTQERVLRKEMEF